MLSSFQNDSSSLIRTRPLPTQIRSTILEGLRHIHPPGVPFHERPPDAVTPAAHVDLAAAAAAGPGGRDSGASEGGRRGRRRRRSSSGSESGGGGDEGA